MVADSARHPIHLQSGRRARQPERSDAEDQERTGDRPAHKHHVLTRLGRQAGRSDEFAPRPSVRRGCHALSGFGSYTTLALTVTDDGDVTPYALVGVPACRREADTSYAAEIVSGRGIDLN